MVATKFPTPDDHAIVENTTERVLGPSYKFVDKHQKSGFSAVTVAIPPGCHFVSKEGLEVLLEQENNEFFFDGSGGGREPMLQLVDALRQGDTHQPQTIPTPGLKLVKRAPKKT